MGGVVDCVAANVFELLPALEKEPEPVFCPFSTSTKYFTPFSTISVTGESAGASPGRGNHSRKTVMAPEDLDACRVIFGEADMFPGLNTGICPLCFHNQMTSRLFSSPVYHTFGGFAIGFSKKEELPCPLFI